MLAVGVTTAVSATPAAATSSDRVLILAGTVTGGSSSIEASEAVAQGLAVDVVDATTWSSMTAAQFASYRAIILGDPTCQSITSDEQAAAANAKTWGPVVNGNIVILGTDPVYHTSQGGETLTRRGVDFAEAQTGKTGAYISLSCYYHGTAANTPVPLLDGIGSGGFTVTGVGCYDNAHIVAESPALTGLTDADISNWSCSVHEAFQTWPGALVPLAIARDFDSSYTASDGSQGPPYILAGGDIKSFPLSLSPLNDSATAGGTHTVTAQLLDGVTRAPLAGAKIGFKVASGPNAGASGSCAPSACITDSGGQVSFTYLSHGTTGTDSIQAYYDSNTNGIADAGEPQTTAGMTWTAVTRHLRYVVLGDSVPYGHGLANPTKDTQDGFLAPNEGPSILAWPERVRRGLPAFLPLAYRPTGCALVGADGTHYDQLAISGAPAEDNTWTGKDDDCRYANGQVPPHRAVTPNEIIAANLRANPPALVTIQVGADDIDFAACLASLLGVPANPWMHVENCVNVDHAGNYHLTPKVSAELGFLREGLTATIKTIHGAAPHARIVLVDYYEMIPEANADLTGTSAICHNLRASRKGGNWRQQIRAKADFVQSQLNSVISSVAGQYADVAVTDVSNLFEGHEMCTLDSWVYDGLWKAAHPTQEGQKRIGDAVLTECATLPDDCGGR